jgi:Asp-tRNA(Asn)/Glu-tRNA(Gln) amidotransferase A subunit family amidase
MLLMLGCRQLNGIHGPRTTMNAIHDVTAYALSSAYRGRELSPVEVARAALARIEAWEKKINAMYMVDAAGALAQATASEVRWRTGAPLSALDGVPITIKDNIAVKGIPTPVGTAAGDLTPAVADAPPSARVREAGCVILGKTTMPDFGMLASGISSLHGTTRNPWNLVRNPAGSSSGAGAGLVAGYAPLALGTDTGGSVRLPAAYNGVFALKPSFGRVPIYPPFLGRVTGPMTRTVTDAALLMTALTKPDPTTLCHYPARRSIGWARCKAVSRARSSASFSTSASALSRSPRCAPPSRQPQKPANAPVRW